MRRSFLSFYDHIALRVKDVCSLTSFSRIALSSASVFFGRFLKETEEILRWTEWGELV